MGYIHDCMNWSNVARKLEKNILDAYFLLNVQDLCFTLHFTVNNINSYKHNIFKHQQQQLKKCW